MVSKPAIFFSPSYLKRIKGGYGLRKILSGCKQ